MKNLIVLPLSLAFVSCGHIYTKSETYAQSTAVEVNGAKVSSAVKPNGGNGGMSFSAMVYMAGSGKLEGPFLWRIQAEGDEGVHEKMIVHRVKVETAKTKRVEWFPQKYLGKYVTFKPYKKTPGVVYANFQLPGELKVMSDVDGEVTVTADVTVTTNKNRRRKLVKFSLKPSSEKEMEFLFIPTEIIEGHAQNPLEWRW